MSGLAVLELTLPQLLSYVRRTENVPTATKDKKAKAEPVKKKKVKAEAIEEPKKKAQKAETPKKKKKVTSSLTARECVLRVLVTGAPRAEIKARAKKVAAEEGADVSFKTFDVGFFIKHLESKGYVVEEKKKAGTIKLIPPKAEAKKAKAAK